MRTSAATIVTAFLLVVYATSLPAQNPPTHGSDPTAIDDRVANPTSASSQPATCAPLAQVGTWEFGLWSREAIGNSANGDVGDAYVTMVGLQTGYVFARPSIKGRERGSLEYFFDVIPVFVLTKPQVTYGGGLSPVGLKWNFLNHRQTYVAFSGGGILTTRNVPPGKTSNLNFTVTGTAGLAIWSRQNRSVSIGAGYWHLSNAKMGESNPSLNALQFAVEYRWYKLR